MRAIVLESHGGPEVLEVAEVPDPAPGPEEVLMSVAATAVNRADILQRMGLYPGPPMAHEIPGLEFAGVVAGIGARVTAWSTGDEVMGIVGGGAYAEQLVVHERQLMAVPATVGLPDAGAVPEVFVTAYDALVLQGGVGSGDWVLVHAGASGVGTAAIQIARLVGASVIATCSAPKAAACESLGADVVVDHSTGDFVEVTRAATGGRGADVVLDVVGGDYVARNIAAASVGARIVQVGVMGGANATVPVGQLLAKRVKLIGTVLRARPLEEKIEVSRLVSHALGPAFDRGALRPVIDRRMPLWDVAEAHELIQANATVGKILLTL